MADFEIYDPFQGKLGFALASRRGPVVHVSGMTGFRPEDMSVPDGIEAQMRLAYTNIRAILDHFGSSLDRLIEQTVFFVGEAEPARAAFDVISKEVFGNRPPPCTMIGATALVDPRYRVEIKVLALAPES